MFNPYSGVKTSILILDRAVAKASEHLAFFKIENDGFALGAQRKAVKGSQLAQVKAELGAWLQAARAGGGEGLESSLGSAVERARLAEGGDYNLSAERYAAATTRTSQWPMVKLGEVVRAKSGNGKVIKGTLSSEPNDGLYPAYSATGQDVFSPEYDFDGKGIVVSAVGARCGKCFLATGKWQAIANTHVIIADETKALTEYLFLFLNDESFWVKGGSAQPFVKVNASLEIEIPLPPLEVQREIVAEVEGYQRVIDGARAVLDNYRPHIPVDPEWPIARIGEIGEVKGGKRLPNGAPFAEGRTPHPYIRVSDFQNQSVRIEGLKYISEEVFSEISRYVISSSDVYISIAGTIGLTGCVPDELDGANLTENAAKIIPNPEHVGAKFLALALGTEAAQAQIKKLTHAVGVPKLALERIRTIEVPLPPLDAQQALVAEIEAEQALVNGNRNLIARFERKIEAAIARVWGEAKGEG